MGLTRGIPLTETLQQKVFIRFVNLYYFIYTEERQLMEHDYNVKKQNKTEK